MLSAIGALEYEEDDLKLLAEFTLLDDDFMTIVFDWNIEADDRVPIGKLMHDFRCTSALDMFYPQLAKPVRYLKKTEGDRSQVCKAMEERIDRERIETLFDVVKNLMGAMKMSAEQATAVLKIPDDDRAILSKRF